MTVLTLYSSKGGVQTLICDLDLLPAFAPNLAAAKAYQALWAEIQREVFIL